MHNENESEPEHIFQIIPADLNSFTYFLPDNRIGCAPVHSMESD